MKRRLTALALGAIVAASCAAQDPRAEFEQYRQQQLAEFRDYSDSKRREFDEYRLRVNREFAEYLEREWRSVVPKPPVEIPKERKTPPQVTPVAPPKPPVAPAPKPVEEVVRPPKPKPAPEPVKPILPDPAPTPTKPVPQVEFLYCGTPMKVRGGRECNPGLTGNDNAATARGWRGLADAGLNNTISDCLGLRKERNLCDWAYLGIVDAMARKACGGEGDNATLLTAFVMSQSGYSVKLAQAGGRLWLLYEAEGKVFQVPSISVGGKNYYSYGKIPNGIYVSEATFPGSKPLALAHPKPPKTSVSPTPPSEHQSKRSDLSAAVMADRNLLDFYATYPRCQVGGNLVAQWAPYAEMAMPEHIARDLYPQLRRAVAGLGQLEAVEKILNWIQTGFTYEYDDKVWGSDRAFFPEETLHYPYCDCEDRAILLTRILRDLLKLDCLLVYYPGHLAAAVCLTEGNPTGDYFLVDGKRFFIADPTITGCGAPVGCTMRGMDNGAARVVRLGK